MRSQGDIRIELEDAIRKRAELWNGLADAHDPEKAAEADRLSERIEELWMESRTARVQARFGDPERIIARARTEERLERESRRLREAA